ncbi:MAG: hypothetical protein KUL75_07830 [Sterolibacterium sp.]|nr:hypothetical protein [Sterolibacterium sp.]
MKTTSLPIAIDATRQRGVALIMALIMLIVVTLVALSGMRNTSLQEKLAGNLYDRAIALQTADAALAAAETWILENERSTLLSSGKIEDCTLSSANCLTIPANTFQANGNGWTSVTLENFNDGVKADSSPQYYIQFLGLKNSEANTSTKSSSLSLQYGATGGGSDIGNNPQNATYRVIARSSQPTTNNDRAVAVVSSLVKGS